MERGVEPGDHEARLGRERRFHDRAFSSDGERVATERFYEVDSGKRAYHERVLSAVGPGRRVLVYGCGPFGLASKLAERGADAVGIDISPVAVRRARKQARRQGIESRHEVMDAHVLDFPDASFDLVCGSGILHHLDLEVALAELSRVLRQDGEAVFFEPLGTNPLINLYRRATPAMRTPDEHPLVDADFALARESFAVVERDEHSLLALLGSVFRRFRWAQGVVVQLQRLDRWLFHSIPAARRLAWTVVVRFTEPRASIRTSGDAE